jgi:hypothetical protein
MAAILENQDGRLNVVDGSGAYQKWKPMVQGYMWKKFGAFVRHVHIKSLSCLTTRNITKLDMIKIRQKVTMKM